MKKNGYLIVTLTLLLIGCGGKHPDRKNTLPIRPEYLPYLSGEWVVPAYRLTLEETKSEEKAFKALEGMGAISIYPQEGDSLEVLILYNNHEGIGGYILPDSAGRKAGFSALKLAYGDDGKQFEIGMEESDNRYQLVLCAYGEMDSLAAEVRFECIRPNGGNMSGPESVAAQTLYVGRYEVTDAKDGKARNVTLSPDLTVVGMGALMHYGISTDFATPSIESIYFMRADRNVDCRYGVKRTDEGFDLYEIIEDSETGLDKCGKPITHWEKK